VFRSKVFQTFLSLVRSQPAAEFLDLGPVVGSNIAFFGERVSCKIYVEDLYADLDRHAREGALDKFPQFLRERFTLADASLDGVLGWDFFDYLDADAAAVLADELVRMLRPGGALLAFFTTIAARDTYFTRYVIEDEAQLRYRVYESACGRRSVLQNRDIMKLFARVSVFDSVLMKSGVREMLFQKPMPTQAAAGWR
jgi:SAM-dependent methyltransferase